MNPSTIAGQIRTALDTIAGLRIAVGPGTAIVVPAAVLGMPGEARRVGGGTSPLWRLDWPLWVLVGRPNERLTLARLAEWSATSGATSVVATLHGYTWTACDYVQVTGVTSETVTLDAVEYAAAAFTLDVTGR